MRHCDCDVMKEMNCAFALLFAIFNATAIPMMKCWCAVCKFCIIARYSWMTRMIHSRETQGVGGRGLAHGIAGRNTPWSGTNARMTGEKQLFFFYRFTLFFKKRTHVIKNYHVLIFWKPQERYDWNLIQDNWVLSFFCGLWYFAVRDSKIQCVHYKNRHVYIWLSCHFVRTWLL